MNSLRDARVGQRVSFAYNGGSTPGTVREVYVQEVQDDRIVGVLPNSNVRQYLFEKATMVILVSELPTPAEAACNVDPTEVIDLPTHRVRSIERTFVEARQRLHEEIDLMNGEDLTEVLVEVDGEHSGQFDANAGMVVVERNVLVPHCIVNPYGHRKGTGIDWVNEDGNTFTTTFFNDNGKVRLYSGGNEVTAETIVQEIAQHLDLTITDTVL